MERLRQWHLEARWQPPDTYASMTNTVRHKSQQTHFSRAEPLVSADTHTNCAGMLRMALCD